ncbi:MAG: hypothetical protein JRG67_03130 [Deltaproteobacteria bacterium]|nr:hypothetical protein [Deltaproteobacteria bacterium]
MKLPLRGNRLRAKALSAALNAYQQQALGGRQPELLGSLGVLEGRLPFPKPRLELVEASYVAHLVIVGEVLEHARTFDDLTLGFEHPDEVLAPQHAVLDDGLGDDLSYLEEGEAMQRGKQLGHVYAR